MLDVLEIKQAGIVEEEQRGVLRIKDEVKLVGVGETGAGDRVRRRQVIGCGHA